MKHKKVRGCYRCGTWCGVNGCKVCKGKKLCDKCKEKE